MQFSSTGNLEKHGFARNRFWSVDNDPPPLPSNSSTKSFVDLILKPTQDDIKTWPHRSVFNYNLFLQWFYIWFLCLF